MNVGMYIQTYIPSKVSRSACPMGQKLIRKFTIGLGHVSDYLLGYDIYSKEYGTKYQWHIFPIQT